MILGRSVALWNGLVIALAAAVIATAKAAGIAVDVEMIAADVTVASVILGIIANATTPGTVPTFSLRTKAPYESWQDLKS